MMAFIVLVAMVTLMMMVTMWGLTKLKRVHYRIDEANIIRLIEGVLAGQIDETQWSVFTAVPISYDEQLESIRQQALIIEAQHLKLSNLNGHIFDEQGEEKLRHLLNHVRLIQRAKTNPDS